MKQCPTCKTQWDELKRFCPYDGTQLVDFALPPKTGVERLDHLNDDVPVPSFASTSQPDKLGSPPLTVTPAELHREEGHTDVVQITLPVATLTPPPTQAISPKLRRTDDSPTVRSSQPMVWPPIENPALLKHPPLPPEFSEPPKLPEPPELLGHLELPDFPELPGSLELAEDLEPAESATEMVLETGTGNLTTGAAPEPPSPANTEMVLETGTGNLTTGAASEPPSPTDTEMALATGTGNLTTGAASEPPSPADTEMALATGTGNLAPGTPPPSPSSVEIPLSPGAWGGGDPLELNFVLDQSQNLDEPGVVPPIAPTVQKAPDPPKSFSLTGSPASSVFDVVRKSLEKKRLQEQSNGVTFSPHTHAQFFQLLNERNRIVQRFVESLHKQGFYYTSNYSHCDDFLLYQFVLVFSEDQEQRAFPISVTLYRKPKYAVVVSIDLTNIGMNANERSQRTEMVGGKTENTTSGPAYHLDALEDLPSENLMQWLNDSFKKIYRVAYGH